MVPVTSVSLLKILGENARSPRWTEFANKYAATIDQIKSRMIAKLKDLAFKYAGICK